MKNSGKLLCLAFALLLCLWASAGAEVNATPLTLNTPTEVTIPDGGGYAYFSFTPDETGSYDFFSTADEDTYGYLYDASMQRLASDDDGGEGTNFKISYQLEAGTLYYFGARFYYSEDTGTFTVTLQSKNLFAAADGNTTVYVVPNEAATLRVTASARQGDVHYQWYNSSTGALIEGATEAEYTTEHLTARANYYCRVTDDYDNSTTIYFYVYMQNNFSAQASGTTQVYVSPNAPAELAITASCDVGEIHYQWYKYENYYTAIEDATEATYITDPITTYSRYYCRVSDDYDNSTTIYFYVYVQNHFRAQPSGSDEVYVSPNAPAELAVIASCDSGEIHYQWYNSSASIAGATAATYTTDPISEYSEFTCRVSDDYGNNTTVRFYVYVENGFHAERVGKYRVYVLPGETATLAVTASCNEGDLHYSWDIDADDSCYSECSDLDKSSVEITGIVSSFEATCYISDDYGNNETIYFDIILDNGFGVDPYSSNIVVPYGETATLNVSAYCDDDQLSYQWYGGYNDEVWGGPEEIEGADGPTLITQPITSMSSYYCEVWDNYGNSAYLSFEISVDNEFHVERVGGREIEAPFGQPVTLTVNASCATGELSYAWSGDYYSSETRDWEEFYDQEGGASLTLDASYVRGDFHCTVRDQYGNSDSIYFELYRESDLSGEAVGPQSIHLAVGQSATLKVTASSSAGGLQYSWYRNGRIISGATAAEYTTPALTGTTLFRCEIQDATDAYTMVVSFACVIEDGSSATVLALNEPTDVSLSEGDFRFYAFTPGETGVYTIESSGSEDTYCHLFDADFEEIARNDDGGYHYNFRLTRELTAGQTYYFGIRTYDYESGRFTILLTGGSGESPRPEGEDKGMLALRVGQTVSFPEYDDGDSIMIDVEELISSNEAVLSTSGDSVTAVAAGTARLTVVYEESYVEWTYTVVVDGGSAIAFPSGLRQVEAEAFAGDASLHYAMLSDSVSRVERDAFNGSGLKQLYVPGMYTTLGGASLRGTDNPTIVCRRGSRAARYAREHGYTFVYLP